MMKHQKNQSSSKLLSLILCLAMIIGVIPMNSAFSASQSSKEIAGTDVTKLYLNGESGDDSMDGTTPDKAVRTFQKAKEIATENQGILKIVIIGTTPIQGNISLAGTKAVLIRGDVFNDFLLKVEPGTEATLSEITVDGNQDNNLTVEKSLIRVGTGSVLTIANGTSLIGNRIKDIDSTITTGGAVTSFFATINMTGGVIEDNAAVYGGGIYLLRSTMNFSGGRVTGNTAKQVFDVGTAPTQLATRNSGIPPILPTTAVAPSYSAGGGILAVQGSTVNMSDEAEVTSNYSHEIGGGISLGYEQGGLSNVLHMTGGTVSDNTAGSAGGGLFIQAKLPQAGSGASKAYISGGKITNNMMEETGERLGEYGGGGIFVSGVGPQPEDNGALYLTNVLITENKAREYGAGIASAPVSDTKIYETNGGAIYENPFYNPKPNSSGKDFYILSSDSMGSLSGHPDYKLANRMLGGVLNKWKNEDGTLLDESRYTGKLEATNESLGLYTDARGNDLTTKLTKVTIAGNKSETSGGGISNNGTLIIGIEGTTQVSVAKMWEDNKNAEKKRPEFVTVHLVATVAGNKDYLVETKKLNEQNGWKTVFSDLPTEIDGATAVYTVKEDTVKGYKASIKGTAKDGYVITNTLEKPQPPEIPEVPILPEQPGEPTPPQQTKISVQKIWSDFNNQMKKRPNQVTIRLLADGVETGTLLILNKENAWKGTFENLPTQRNGAKIQYTIKEDTVKGYKVSIKGTAKDGYVITNTLEKPQPPEIPEVPILPEQPGEPTSPQQTKISVQKIWSDFNNQMKKRPNQVTVRLLADGVETGTLLILNKENAWKGTFENLPTQRNGAKIQYTIKEDTVKGYKASIKGAAKDGYVIINRYLLENPSDIPHTGATSNSALWLWISMLSLLGIMALSITRRKKDSIPMKRNKS